MDLNGKAALVTGGGTGLGRAIALVLAGAGCDVAVNFARSRDEAEATAAEIRALGRRAVALQGDVSDQADAHRIVAETVAAFGGIDVLVNNAGVTRGVRFADLAAVTPDDWQRILGVNVVAHFWTVQVAAPLMAARGGGSILNVTSNSAFTNVSSSLVYSVSKSAATALTRLLARAVPEGVRVNAIAPGWMETRWIDAYVLPELRERVRSGELPVVSLEATAAMALEIIRNDGMVGETVMIDAGDLARG